MTMHPWVARNLSLREGPFVASTAVHTSGAAKALARLVAHNRRQASDAPFLPEGGLRLDVLNEGQLLAHGVFATPTARLFVFSDRSALVARGQRVVPFVWRIGTQPPQIDGMPEGTVLLATFGDRSAKPALVLANAEQARARTWAIAIPHDRMRFTASYPAYAQEVSRLLMDHVDRLADRLDGAPAIALDPLNTSASAWLAPFQTIEQPMARSEAEALMPAFAAALHLFGATRGGLHSARVGLDGQLEWKGTWATQWGIRGNEVDVTLTRKVVAALPMVLRAHGLDPMRLVHQSDSFGTHLATKMILETDAQRPTSRHLEMALLHALHTA